MKKSFTLIVFVLLAGSLLFSRQVSAQAPGKMSYQAVIRDVEGKLVAGENVGMKISILQGTVEGTVVYTETRTPKTNANGLVTFKIGGEETTAVSGIFSAIDWVEGPYFIKTETDPFGGTNYTITVTSWGLPTSLPPPDRCLNGMAPHGRRVQITQEAPFGRKQDQIFTTTADVSV